MTIASFVDLSRTEVIVSARLYTEGDEDGFGIVDDRGFWWSALYASRAGAERARALAAMELTHPEVVPVLLQGNARHRIRSGDWLILSPDNYRTSMPAAEFSARFMPVDEWESRKATQHEWLPKRWRRAPVATSSEVP